MKTEIKKRKRPKDTSKYTRCINVGFTREQWSEVNNWAQRANLEPAVYIRKVLLDFLSIPHQTTY